MKSKIELAVAPLKDDAVKRAEQEARALVAKVEKQLKEAGNDLKVCAPYPSSLKDSRSTYFTKLSKYKLFSSLTKGRKASYFLDEPMYVDMCPEYVERFVEESKKDAAADYDAFVAKLVSKIGEVEEASLSGNHVWSYSILTVTKKGEVKEHWKTQMIVNVSKLGKLFNQWPTRKVKK